MKRICIIGLGCVLVVAVAVYFTCFYNIFNECEVLFIPGWKTKNNITRSVKHEIQKIFRTSRLSIHEWESNGDWKVAKNNAENEARLLSQAVMAMSPERQKKLVLAGHSLGGRIVVRTAKLLKAQNVKVKQIILLGAAVNCDDPDLQACSQVSAEPFINVFNCDDNVLKLAYGNMERALAVGYCGVKGKYPNMKQYRKTSGADNDLANVFEHHVDVYLEFLAAIREGREAEYVELIDHHKIKFEKTFLSLPPNIYLIAPGAVVKESYHGWKLCYYKLADIPQFQGIFGPAKSSINLYLIVGPYGEFMWNLSETMIKPRWNQVKNQINEQLEQRKKQLSKSASQA